MDPLPSDNDLLQLNYEKHLARNRLNDIPQSDIERSQLRALIDVTANELQECDENDARLAERRILLAKTLELQKSLLSSIRQLPYEILEQIFTLATFDSNWEFNTSGPYIRFGSESIETKPKLTGAIFVLTWVCYRWRNHVLSRHFLWSYMRLSLMTVHDVFDAEGLVKECIMRSRLSPIHLVMDIRKNAILPLIPHQVTVLDTVTEHLGRWKSFEIRVDSSEALHYVLDKVEQVWSQTYFHLLESFALHYEGSVDTPLLSSGRSFLSCPRLHTLGITYLDPADRIDLAKLTTLEIMSEYVGSTFAILLKTCPLLENCIIWGFADLFEEYRYPSIPNVHHIHLKRLSIRWFCDCAYSAGVWHAARLPNLTHLSVWFADEAEDMDDEELAFRNAKVPAMFDELKQMILHSQCVLKEVSLDRNGYLGSPQNAEVVRSFFKDLTLASESSSCFLDGQSYEESTFLEQEDSSEPEVDE